MQQIVLLVDLDYSVKDIDNPERIFVQVLASDIMGFDPEELALPFKHLVNPDTCLVVVSHDIFSGTASVDSFFVERDENGKQN